MGFVKYQVLDREEIIEKNADRHRVLTQRGHCTLILSFAILICSGILLLATLLLNVYGGRSCGHGLTDGRELSPFVNGC